MSSKKKKRHRLPKDERLAQLSRYAVVVAARKGIGRIAHADVARAATVSTPTVFQYFPNREALVTCVVREVARFYVHQYEACLDPTRTAHYILQNLFRTYADSVDTHPEYAMVWLEWSTSVRNEAGIWDSFLEYHDQLIPAFAAVIRRGQMEGTVSPRISAKNAARMIEASSYTITQLKFIGRARSSINKYIVQLIDAALGEPIG